ncbi:MAG: hypothetical protein SCH66_06075 [Methanolobus sp.]|nr:hypothetical protein [Methanolobus sp.]
MKKESLLDVLIESELRLDLLLSLREGAKEVGILITALGVDEHSLLPHINILHDYHLITICSERYELTSMGEILLDQVISLLSQLEKVKV